MPKVNNEKIVSEVAAEYIVARACLVMVSPHIFWLNFVIYDKAMKACLVLCNLWSKNSQKLIK